jgi:hypothetical protein
MSRRMFRLMLSHQRIDEQIRRERRRRLPDMVRLFRLMRLKLRAKDLIQRHLLAPRRAG